MNTHLEIVLEKINNIKFIVEKYYHVLIASDRASFHFLSSNLYDVTLLCSYMKLQIMI